METKLNVKLGVTYVDAHGMTFKAMGLTAYDSEGELLGTRSKPIYHVVGEFGQQGTPFVRAGRLAMDYIQLRMKEMKA